MKYIETIVIGAGQAGLATSYYLTQHTQEHLVIEQSDKAASVWPSRSWDSFTLVTPKWAFKMPGVASSADERDRFMSRDEVIKFFEDYIRTFKPPIKYNTKVLTISIGDDGCYIITTSDAVYTAKNVVIATGFFQHPRIPPFAKHISTEIKQLHSSAYRKPASVPEGAVLIVGSGQSGCQIAEELLNAGRKVFLCVGTAGRVPRRYRGKDIIEWLQMIGLFELTPEQLPPGMGKFEGIPHLTGADGGHTINLHQFARDGITLLGHLHHAEENKIVFAPDLHNSLSVVDNFESEAITMIDDYIAKNELNQPEEILLQLRDGYEQPLIEELDLTEAGINTIIWATGYSFDYSMIKLPVLDQDGFPIQSRGAAEYPGLYFVGMPWMPSEKSGFLLGVAESAQHIVSNIMMQPDLKKVR